ncbi:MAG TPA: MarR family transcriptional regulator [Kribbella sp.]|uniref:MarR family winged helix-turn-helix transcriptional regulator n=1 Tax=Kribbella sp. TaxID=1871183 RepID=UPI002D771FE6|nr:MarR family transcriptional regulator [Kribbella sp.]HET6293023.1 MarR family transcriptional regulator [Kribbella sp.]
MTSSSPERRGGAATSVEADLGWALGVVFRRYAKEAAAALDSVPGGPRGYQVLTTVTGDGPKRQLDLAAQLSVDRTVMTYLLDDLEEAGVVQRQPDPADRRARLIVATDQGKEAVCELERRLSAAEHEVLGSLDEGERLIFRMLLQRVAVRADAADPVDDACALADADDITKT